MVCALQGVARDGAVTCSAEAAARLQDVEAGDTLGVEEQPPPSSPPADTAAAAESPVRHLAREERRRAIRYTAGAAAFVGALVALYHATSQRGTSAVAGLLAPAAIMVLYLLWVLYSTRANRHAARLAAAAAEANAQPAVVAAEEGTTAATSLEPRPLSRAPSKLVLNGPTEGRSLASVPRGLRSSSAALHRSTESLYQGGPRGLQPASVHRSTMNLSRGGQRGGGLSAHRHGGGRMMRSTLQLNNSRQVAAAAANLPTYEEATNRSHWLLTNNSRERLLRQ